MQHEVIIIKFGGYNYLTAMSDLFLKLYIVPCVLTKDLNWDVSK